MEPLTPKSISKISAALRKVKEVLENLTMMADFLDVSQDTKLTNCNLQTKPGYDCIKNILSDWAAREGSKATLKSLQDTFVEMDLNQAAGNEIKYLKIYELLITQKLPVCYQRS